MSALSALVLAGSRGGIDPVAQYAGVTHKALIPLGGATLLERVMGALKAAGATRIAVCSNDHAVAQLAAQRGAETSPAQSSLSASVRAGIELLGAPVLITTSDHALLQADWIKQFVDDAPAESDICVLLARRDVVEAAAPSTQRTYLKFADGQWSGCNLFLIRTPRALSAIDLWRKVEADRKKPWRIVRLLGPATLQRYILGRLTLADAVARMGRLSGIDAAVVASKFGLAAVDVDKPADLDLVRTLVSEPSPPNGP
ncbi:MAG: NTP transferase domain-containing protein [Caulobacterales bacterium]